MSDTSRPRRAGIENAAPQDFNRDLSEEQKAEIERWVNFMGTWENLQRVQQMTLGDEAYDVSQILVAQNNAAKVHLGAICRELLDEERWKQLAETPAAFTSQLNKKLTEIRRLQKSIYGIQKHRPKKNARRDKRIRELRDDAGLEFGKIALTMNRGDGPELTEQTVRMAYERDDERQRLVLRQFAKTVVLSRQHPEQRQQLVHEFLDYLRDKGF